MSLADLVSVGWSSGFAPHCDLLWFLRNFWDYVRVRDRVDSNAVLHLPMEPCHYKSFLCIPCLPFSFRPTSNFCQLNLYSFSLLNKNYARKEKNKWNCKLSKLWARQRYWLLSDYLANSSYPMPHTNQHITTHYFERNVCLVDLCVYFCQVLLCCCSLLKFFWPAPSLYYAAFLSHHFSGIILCSFLPSVFPLYGCLGCLLDIV